MNSVNASGGSISTRIRQANYDPLNIEARMYMGKQMVSLYGREIKKATWSQLFWKTLGASSYYGDNEVDFYINGAQADMQYMDYLLAVAIEAVFPRVNLANTAAPRPYNAWFTDRTVDMNLMSDLASMRNLYFYLSDGTGGLVKGTVYIGTLPALQALAPSASVETEQVTNQISGVIRPLVSYSPRHRVSWSSNALLAAIDCISFSIGDVVYEELDRHALYNALQFRLREDVYPVAADEATTPSVNRVIAGVGDDAQVILGNANDSDMYKAFTVPFSFTTSAIADRGDSGNHKSAFPVLLACRETIKVTVKVIDDLRRVLVLEEELMEDLSCAPVVFVATVDELYPNGTSADPISYMHIVPDGFNTFFSVTFDSFIPSSSGTYYATSGDYTVLSNTANPAQGITYGTNSRMKLGALGATYLVSTGEYGAVTRPTDHNLDNPFSRDIDYREWFTGPPIRLGIKAKARGATVTRLEAGMMKKDCRNKLYLYERYNYTCSDQFTKPGDKYCLDIGTFDGQFKYAYLFAQNELSRLQGHWFNYTNDTDYELVETQLGPRYVFQGKSAIEKAVTTVWGHKDDDSNYLFQRYVDNPLFAQRAPRDLGLAIVPRYSNWINSIHPDGSTASRQVDDFKVHIKTARSGTVSNRFHPLCGKPCTYGYNVHIIAVCWNVIMFRLEAGCELKLPPRHAN